MILSIIGCQDNANGQINRNTQMKHIGPTFGIHFGTLHALILF